MIDEIARKFESVVIKYYEIRLYRYDDAVKVIDECEARQIKIWGFDSFKLVPPGIQPFMEFSPDYSKIEASLTWQKAREDIEKCSHMDFVFEVVY